MYANLNNQKKNGKAIIPILNSQCCDGVYFFYHFWKYLRAFTLPL